MKLVDVYSDPDAAVPLWNILLENVQPGKSMPEWTEYQVWIVSRPYKEWFLVTDCGIVKGEVHLTEENELYVHILKKWQRQGFGIFAVTSMMLRHCTEPLKVNIYKNFDACYNLFKSLGFIPVKASMQLETWRNPYSMAREPTDECDAA